MMHGTLRKKETSSSKMTMSTAPEENTEALAMVFTH